MRRLLVLLLVVLLVGALVAAVSPASAEHKTEPSSNSMHALGHSPQPATFAVPDGQRVISSDIAFQGRYAYQGNYNGFRVIDIKAPGNPKLIATTECNGDQGDLVVYEHVLVRTWNTKRSTDRACGGETVPAGFEGIHVWDISDPANPSLEGSLELPCGSHTATMAGVDGGDLIVYSNNSSSSGCGVGLTTPQQNALGDFMDVIAIPLNDLGNPQLIHREPLAGPTDPAVRSGCHDAAVIRGDVDLVACASADTINVWSIANDIRNPDPLFTITEPGVGDAASGGRWHSAAFTWDGKVLVAGWEPGGGGAGECEADDPDVDKSMFFYDMTDNGAKLGRWLIPDQGADENCTIHNYNVVPLRSGRYVVTSGNYQGGTWVVDFTDPANAVAVAWQDPVSLGPGPFCGGLCQIGGSWSSYWYNNFVYESDITRGLNVFRVSASETGGAIKLDRLNPQTQEFSLD